MPSSISRRAHRRRPTSARIEGETATVEVAFIVKFQGQKMEQPRVLRLAKEDGQWRLSDRLF